jgi:hypothetical protein
MREYMSIIHKEVRGYLVNKQQVEGDIELCGSKEREKNCEEAK